MSVITRGLITCALGSVVGVAIGLWFVYSLPPGFGITAPAAPAASSSATQVQGSAAAPLPPPPEPAPTTEPGEPDDLLERARALAEQPDVNGLIALRESAVESAAQQGLQETAATKQRIAEVDRYLELARARRLALDREEFLKAGDRVAPKNKP